MINERKGKIKIDELKEKHRNTVRRRKIVHVPFVVSREKEWVY
jgi:hypothetical protein